MTVDVIFICTSLLVGFGLFFDGSLTGANAIAIPENSWLWFKYMCIVAAIVSITVYTIFHMYSNLWKYASIDEVFKIFVASTIIFLILYLFDNYYLASLQLMVLPRRLIFVAWTVNTLLFAFSRFGYRLLKRLVALISHILSNKSGLKRVMIVGAGFAGYGVVRGIVNKKIRDKVPAIIIDNDSSKNNTNILGVRVLSGTDRIVEIAEKYFIDEIIVAMPDASNIVMKQIMEQCTLTECSLKIMPPLSDVSNGKNNFQTLRDVSISDLLCRSEVNLDSKNISDYLSGRTILVTGGGGSIGSELCRQISKFKPNKIVIFDIYENNAYELMIELKSKYRDKLDVVIRIGSVRDEKRLQDVFEEFNPQVVFHAAAHKHVVLMEDSPAEAVKNNVFGTLNVVSCADKYKIERFVLLSTDKAVNPTNVMGATKRITELIMQHMSSKSKTKFMAVRFGNVLGSNGSVIPLFKQQIASGGPVTVTHPDIERYFMTIPEASQLVLQAAGLGKSGRIFVLDMGSPIKINDLAKNLIKLSGYRPDKDIEIIYTGLRAGEKLYEELILDEEKDQLQKTFHNKIMMANPINLDYELFEKQLETLYKLAHNEPLKVESYLSVIVTNYVPTKNDTPKKNDNSDNESIKKLEYEKKSTVSAISTVTV